MPVRLGIVDAPIPSYAPDAVILTQRIAEAVIEGIAQFEPAEEWQVRIAPEQAVPDGVTPSQYRSTMIENDPRRASCAYQIDPDRVLMGVETLPEALRTEAKAAISEIVAFARSDRRLISVHAANRPCHEDARTRGEGRPPVIWYTMDRVGAPSTEFHNYYLKKTLSLITLDCGKRRTMTVRADALSQACEGHDDEHVMEIADVARRAIAYGGPDAILRVGSIPRRFMPGITPRIRIRD